VDVAAMRRFLVKSRFDFLSADQVQRAFRKILGCEPPVEMRNLTSLTPADFSLVKRSAELNGTLGDPVALMQALEREQRAKPGVKAPIGFLHLGIDQKRRRGGRAPPSVLLLDDNTYAFNDFERTFPWWNRRKRRKGRLIQFLLYGGYFQAIAIACAS
jgi:hypothetical protein